MRRVQLIHWKPEEAKERIRSLEKAGYEVAYEFPGGRDFFRRLQSTVPDAVVVDMTRLPSQGRDFGIGVRMPLATRNVPIVFAGGRPDKVASVRRILPDAVYAEWTEVADAVAYAIDHPPAQPVVPESSMAGYSGRPLVKKLGIKPGARVCLHNAPGGFEALLGELPDRAVVSRSWSDECSLAVWFVGSRSQLDDQMSKIVEAAGRAPVWISWPKRASAVATDISQNHVREGGLSAGLVDYKVCSVDDTWSALLFTVRKE